MDDASKDSPARLARGRKVAALALLLACAGCAARFSCRASVTDLVSKRTIAAPPVAGRAGSPGTTSQPDPASGAILEVQLAVDGAGRVATCAAAVTKGGLLIASDAARLEVH
jgi:hypothetical protein